MSVTIPRKVVEALFEIGEERDGNLVISLQDLEDATSTRTRTSEADRMQWLQECIDQFGERDGDTIVYDVFRLCEDGRSVSEASAGNQSYWSGISNGSHAAFSLGYKSALVQRRKGRMVEMLLQLTPLTEEQKDAHRKAVAKAAAKAEARKAKEAAKAAAATSTDSDDGGEEALFVDDE